jgi:hypothetical protein
LIDSLTLEDVALLLLFDDFLDRFLCADLGDLSKNKAS